jgi:hypothetical protein
MNKSTRKSWKTTTAGIAAIIAAVALAAEQQFDSDPATVADWAGVVTAVVTGIGLLLARDNDRSSEDVGLK